MPQVNTTYCPPERAVRFALRASEIRTDVRVILPLRGSDIEGRLPFSARPITTNL